MKLQFRARRASSSAGRQERALERIAFWTRPVVLLVTAGTVLVWAEQLWRDRNPFDAFSLLRLLGLAVATVLAFQVLRVITRPQVRLHWQVVALSGTPALPAPAGGWRSVRLHWQVGALSGTLLLALAALGCAGIWLLAGGSVNPMAVITALDLELITPPSGEPPQLITTVHLAWCALVLVVGPLLRLALRLLRPLAAREDGVETTRAAMAADEAEKLRVANRRSSASAPGRKTGFEPSMLAQVELLEQPLRHGEPGLGLETMRGRADLVARGREGERNLAKVLQSRGHLDRFATFWSLQMPSETRGAHDRNRGDIDCVIVTGKRILVLDAKALEQGDVTRYTEGRWLYRRDNATGHDIGRPTELKSAHFRAATDALHAQLQRAGAKQRVAAAVVLMPDDAGLGYADRAFWPGGIPTWDLLQLLDELEHEPPFDERSRHSEHVLRVLRALVKDASGAAPTIRSIERETARRIAAERADERSQRERSELEKAAQLKRERAAAAPKASNPKAQRAAEQRSPSSGRRSTPDSSSTNPYDKLPDQLPF